MYQPLNELASKPELRNRTWLIIGGGGFIGTNLLYALADVDADIQVLTRNRPAWQVHGPNIKYIEQDARELDAYRELIQPGSIVIHLASSTYPGKAEKALQADLQDNVLATVRLAQACLEKNVERFIFISSGGAIYGNSDNPTPHSEHDVLEPISAYGVMKMTTEHYLRILSNLYGLRVSILRIANPYGPWHRGRGQGALNVFLEKIRLGEPIEIWGDGQQVRDFVYIGDAVKAIKLAALAQNRPAFDVFNVGSGTGRSLLEILNHLKKITGMEPNVRYLPIRAVDVNYNVLDTKHIQDALGWVPETKFETGLESTWEWLQHYGERTIS